MATAHIEAEIGEIAEVVIFPGDPLRAKFIAETYFTDGKQINKVRNMFGYTGFYKGKRLTVMGHGMGMPSAGIYAYELYQFYDVKKIIRIGSCGTFDKNLKVLDVILADKAYTESNFAYTLNNATEKVAEASKELTDHIEEKSKELGMKIHKGTIMTGDCFDYYITDVQSVLDRIPKELKIIGVEMEAFAIFYLAKMLGRQAACLATVVDTHYSKEQVSSADREKSLRQMIELALESV